jgi:FAD-dependent urate hydroxylase
VRRALGPAGAWWLKERVVGKVPALLGHVARDVQVSGSRARLTVQGQDGAVAEMTADHVIAATGYRYAISSMTFLSENLLSHLRCVQGVPVLSANFESSVPGLYFTGLASTHHFGPAMRFILGAAYTAKRISSHVAGSRHR